MALKYLKSENIPTEKPQDYFADMLKSDKLMGVIENKMVESIKKRKNNQEVRLREQGKKIQKLVKSEKQKKDAREKKKNLQTIEDWKKVITSKKDDAPDLEQFEK